MGNLNLWRNSFEPFRDANSIAKLMDRMWAEYPEYREVSKNAWNPTCEAKEDAGNYYLKFDLPGVAKEQVKIDLHEDRLTVTGERKEERKTEDKEHRTHFSEMFYGTFTRTMTFPVGVDSEKTEAKFENGVLSITLPKKTGNGARQISIK